MVVVQEREREIERTLGIIIIIIMQILSVIFGAAACTCTPAANFVNVTATATVIAVTVIELLTLTLEINMPTKMKHIYTFSRKAFTYFATLEGVGLCCAFLLLPIIKFYFTAQRLLQIILYKLITFRHCINWQQCNQAELVIFNNTSLYLTS